MPSIDMPLEQMRQYKPPLNREPDFEAFWDQTVAEALRQPINAELVPYRLPAKGLQCYAVRFDGFGGGRIAGWYVRPEAAGRFPGLVIYHGYSRRGARPLEMLHYAAQGMCVLSMDCRGQNGQSQDAAVADEGHFLGWMTKGVRDPATYYYRYVYADAVRAVELLAHRDEVDANRIAVTGHSQGGALSLAAAALAPKRVALCMADIPFLSDFRRSVQLATAGPYAEIPGLLKSFPHLYDDVFRTLSYCDCLNLSPWVRCRTVVSNCLWDDICPPSTIFGVYNHIAAEKQIEVYPFQGHEVPYEHQETKFRVLAEQFGV